MLTSLPPPEGDERDRPGGAGRGDHLADGPQDRRKAGGRVGVCVGRPPARMPDGEAALGFLMRMGSRNAMDANRNDPNYADAVLRLADQRAWPDGVGRRAPCSQQGCNFLRHGCTAMLERALVDMVCHMIRLKLLDCARLRGLFVIAVDGTKQERIRCCRWLGNRANRYVLEAKLVTPGGGRVLGHVGAHKALARQRRGREAGQRVPRLPTPRPEAEGRVPEPRDLHSRD